MQNRDFLFVSGIFWEFSCYLKFSVVVAVGLQLTSVQVLAVGGCSGLWFPSAPHTLCLLALLMAQKPSVFKGRAAGWYFWVKWRINDPVRKKWSDFCCDYKAIFQHRFKLSSVVHKLALSS